MNILFITVAIISMLFGLYVFRQPEKIIEFQKKTYSCVNWRMEPISMSKEIRNTRWMGLFLLLFTIACIIYVCLQ